jgi:chromosomal replication initiation ATPase DnaA
VLGLDWARKAAACWRRSAVEVPPPSSATVACGHCSVKWSWSPEPLPVSNAWIKDGQRLSQVASIPKLSAQYRAVDFRDFLDQIDRQTEPGLAVHVKKSQPLCLIGDSGTGKSHMLIALGTEAAMKGYRVRYTLATKLVNELVEAADEKQLNKTIARYGRVDRGVAVRTVSPAANSGDQSSDLVG